MLYTSRVGRFSLVGFLTGVVSVGAWAQDPALDSDGDGLSNEEEVAHGTQISNPDSDGDGLLDGWEVKGYSSGSGFEPLPVYGANPNRKDVFVEMDWMLTQDGSAQPSAVIAYQSAVDITRAFRKAGGNIEIHFDLGPGIQNLIPESLLEPDVDFTAFVNEPDEEKTLPYQDSFPSRPACGERGASTHLSLYEVYNGGRFFRPSRRNIFYYVLIAELAQSPDAGGPLEGDRNHPYSESFSDDLAKRDGLVSSGVQISVLFRKPFPDISEDLLRYQRSATLLHELGHAFGLGHGGSTQDGSWDNTNWKPNYPSVMNYRFQFCGVDFLNGLPVMDFSHGTIQARLREDRLLEPVGMGKVPNEHILACGELRRLSVSAFSDNVDWNKDGVLTTAFVSEDLNANGKLDEVEFNDHDDWGKLETVGFDGIGLRAYRGCGWSCVGGEGVRRIVGEFNGDGRSDLLFARGSLVRCAFVNDKRQLVIPEPKEAGALPPGRFRFAPGVAILTGDFLGVARDLIFCHQGQEVCVFDMSDGSPRALWYETSQIQPGVVGGASWKIGAADRFLSLPFFDAARSDLAVMGENDVSLISSAGPAEEANGPSSRMVTRWSAGGSLRAWTHAEVPSLRRGRRLQGGLESFLIVSARSLTEVFPSRDGPKVSRLTVDGTIPASAGVASGWEFSSGDCLHTVDLDGDGIEELVLRGRGRMGVVAWDGGGEAQLVWIASGTLNQGEWTLARDGTTESFFGGQFIAGGGEEILISNGQSWVTLGWERSERKLRILGITDRYLPGMRPTWELQRGQVIIPGRFLGGEADGVLVQYANSLLLARFEEGGFRAYARIEGQVGDWFLDVDDVLTPAQVDDDPGLELFARNGARHGVLEVTPPGTSTFLASLEPEMLVFKSVPRFRRGDVNSDGEVDISDVVMTLGYLYLGFGKLGCEDAADVDDNGTINLADPVGALMFLFAGGTLPRPPGPVLEGIDPTDDTLSCEM